MGKAEDTIKLLKTYFEKHQLEKAVIGVSGGIDSAVTLHLLVNAIGNANILAILSPGEHTDFRSTASAEELCDALNVSFKKIPIAKSVVTKVKQLRFHYAEMKQVTLENMQAIERMAFLRAIANEENAIIVGTGNRTEFYLGYFTLGGDGGADIFPILNWSKGEVYKYAEPIEAIPKFIKERKPSAELSENQVDPFDYEEADAAVQRFIDGKTEEKDAQYLELIKKNEHKRKRMNNLLQ